MPLDRGIAHPIYSRSMRRVILLTCVLIALAASGATAATTHDLTGTWSCCAPGSGGVATQTWTVTSMDKSSGAFSGTGRGGSYTFPITGTAAGDSVTLMTGPYNELRSYSAVFRGTLSADSKTLRGEWDDDASPAPDGTFTATRPDAPAPGDPVDPREPVAPGEPPPGTPDPRAPAYRLVPGDLYVSDPGANAGNGALFRVDTQSGRTSLVHQGAPFVGIRDIAFGPGGRLYIADFAASAVHALNTATGAVSRLTTGSTLLFRPWGIAYSSLFGDGMVVTDSQLASVVVVDADTGTVRRLFAGYGIKQPHSIAATLFGQPFVADFDGGKIHRTGIDRTGGWSAGTLKSAPLAQPQSLAIGYGSNGYRFFVTDNTAPGGAGGVWTWLERDPFLRPSGTTNPEQILSGGLLEAPTGVAISSDGRTLYVASVRRAGIGGSIIAFDLVTRRARVLASGFAQPIGLAVAPPRRIAISVGGGDGGSGRGGGPRTTARPTGVSTTVSAPNQPVAVTAGVVVGGLPRAQIARSVRVRDVRRVVPAGRRTSVRVAFPRALARQIRAALADGRRVTARLTVVAVGANGTRARTTTRVRIRR
jgi:hypothetical protein